MNRMNVPNGLATIDVFNNNRFLAHRLSLSGLISTTGIGLVDVHKPSSKEQRAELIAEDIHTNGTFCRSTFSHTIFNTELHTDLKGHNKFNNQIMHIMHIMHIMQFFTCLASRLVLKPMDQKKSLTT
jgi:hypothetical protein